MVNVGNNSAESLSTDNPQMTPKGNPEEDVEKSHPGKNGVSSKCKAPSNAKRREPNKIHQMCSEFDVEGEGEELKPLFLQLQNFIPEIL